MRRISPRSTALFFAGIVASSGILPYAPRKRSSSTATSSPPLSPSYSATSNTSTANASSIAAAAAAAATSTATTPTSPPPKMSTTTTTSPILDLHALPPFQTTFAVPMHCQSCVDALEAAVLGVPGISSASASLGTQTLHASGTAAPSAILAAIQETGRDGVLRGSGAGDASAAVAILETYDKRETTPGESPVRGLVRLVQVAEGVSVVDVSVGGALKKGNSQKKSSSATSEDEGKEDRINGEKVGRLVGAEGKGRASTWRITLRQRGDLSRGPESTGDVYTGEDVGLKPIETPGGGGGSVARGALGEIEVDADGRGSAVLVHPIAVWEVIGRGLVVEDVAPGGQKVAGVVARSAGVWDNDKTVCSCSGKTVWEEREEQRGRGML